jgi:hypothetical protein
MKKISPGALLALTAIAPISLFAHPGHGETEGFSIIHYFTEPVHATVTVLGAIAVFLLYKTLRRNAHNKKA